MSTTAPLRDADSAFYPLLRLITALLLMTLGGSGMQLATVAVKALEVEFASPRALAALAYTTTLLGYGLGGIFWGRVSDRFGVMPPLLFGAVSMAVGYALISQATALWQVIVAHGVLIGFLGMSTTFSPLIADISHWFDRNRGLALGILISGSYVAGTVWPPVIQYLFDATGWRVTYLGFAVFCVLAMLPMSVVLYRRPMIATRGIGDSAGAADGRPLGLAPGFVLCSLCFAGVGCCVAMATPQVHIIPLATDLGYAAQRGAEMTSLIFGFGIVSRLVSGWISDRIGGLATLLLGSSLQAVALLAFIPFDGLVALYIVSALFGLSQGGIVPSYAMIIRTYFPPGSAGWRIGTVLFSTMVGMAFGAWLAGFLYDLTGDYTVSFVVSFGFNLFNILIAVWLIRRARARTP